MSNLVPVAPEDRKGFAFESPIPTTVKVLLSWQDWADYHRALGQELAKRMREYPGPSTDDHVPPDGGRSIALRRFA